MSDRLSDLDPFTVHDPGCHCWPHVSESALSEAVIAVDEYRESMRTIATLRADLNSESMERADAERDIATLSAALETARLELMQDVDPDAVIVGIDAALATAKEAER